MKKKLCLAMSLVLAGSLLIAGCKKEESGLTPVTLNEVAHSIFYAPQYAALELGYFKDEGLDLTLVNGAGADKVMTALVSGDADIGFMGSEASIYVYQEGSEDYAVNFAQLTQRAGNFLVGRQAEDSFSWDSLKGKKVLGGRAGGRPNHDVTFEHIRGIYKWASPKNLEMIRDHHKVNNPPPFILATANLLYHKSQFLRSYILDALFGQESFSGKHLEFETEENILSQMSPEQKCCRLPEYRISHCLSGQQSRFPFDRVCPHRHRIHGEEVRYKLCFHRLCHSPCFYFRELHIGCHCHTNRTSQNSQDTSCHEYHIALYHKTRRHYTNT